MKKIGIISHFYGSRNYGGVLQAYALQEKIEQLGAESAQILFEIHKQSQNVFYKLWLKLLLSQRILPAIYRRIIKKKLTL